MIKKCELNLSTVINFKPMKKIIALFFAAALLAGCSSESSNKNEEAKKSQTSIPQIELAAFNEEAGNYVDQKISVTGIVDHVCRHGGKRLLLVADGADIHVENDQRFDEDLMGNEIEIIGIVREERIDESHCLKMEEDIIESHNAGDIDEDHFENKQKQIEFYRDSMEKANVEYLAFYSLDYVDHKEKK
jgi:PBP1b-binding outer membrane lipoprotein LpoB